MPLPKLHAPLLRLWRLGLLVMAVLVLRSTDAGPKQAVKEEILALTPERLRDFFPDAVRLGNPSTTTGLRPVLDAGDKVLGQVATTSPQSDRIIGYSGPTQTLLIFDAEGTLTGLRVLKSHDTSDHLAEVVADRKFFDQFKGLKPGQPSETKIHTVTGATLTSAAIAQGILTKLGQSPGTSLRFPDEISLSEVQSLIQEATQLRPGHGPTGSLEVLDASGKVIALVVRTSPVTDPLIGYKGPTDTLMVLDAKGATLKKIALRKSYDTKRYVAYVTGDDYFLNLFNNRSVDSLANLDFKTAKIEGVSGATETSWSVAEGLKRRAQSLVEARPSNRLHQLKWRWQDTGHVAVVLSALLMAFTRLRGRAWARHIHHGLLVVYAGFVSAELISQGLLTGWAVHGTPWSNAPGLLLLTTVALLGPIFTGKQLYCHHICPHGALQQLVARRLRWQWRIPAWLDRRLAKLPFLLLAFVFMSVSFGWAVDLNALEPFDAYVFRVAGIASIVIAVGGVIAAMFTPLAYCKYGCPTGALFKLLRFTGDADRLGLRDWLAVATLAIAAFV